MSRPGRLPSPIPVTLISDATGALGRHVLQAVCTQFPPGAFRLHVMTFVNSEERLADCLRRLPRADGLVVHATIYPAFKRRIETACRRHRLPVYDLTGPIVAFLVRASGLAPEVSYGKLHELNPDYFDRIAAIEFAIAHDDGAGLDTLREAEVVLTGVSRTTKTPTSMVLATHGLRAANVPLAPQMAPPPALLAVPPRRVVCLTLGPDQLAAFRAQRVRERFAGVAPGYLDEAAIRQELTYALELADARGWHVLDVTGRAVEETTARIIELVRGGAEPNGDAAPARTPPRTDHRRLQRRRPASHRQASQP